MTDELLNCDKNNIQVVAFCLGDEEYAVPINYVQEIITRKGSTRIPKTRHYIEGMINLRGQIVPVIDSRKLLNVKKSEKTSIKDERVILISLSEEKVGLLVDKVFEVVNLKAEDIEVPPVSIEENVDFIIGVGKYKDRLLILINPEKFLADLDSENVKHLTKVADSIKEAVI